MAHQDDDEARKRRHEDPPEGAGGALGDDDIQIVDVQATDDAGVPLQDDIPDIVIEEEPAERPARQAPARGTQPAPESTAQLERELAAAREAATEAREQMLRTAADFENYRRRVDRDRVEERKQAGASLVKGLLPVLDGLGRALEQARAVEEDSPSVKPFADGVRLIETQLLDILRHAGLEPVETSGVFDPNVHEALMQEATEQAPHMSILAVFEPGWRFGGRLLRPARVKVASNPTDDGRDGRFGDSDTADA